jgi:hypothetical protein
MFVRASIVDLLPGDQRSLDRVSYPCGTSFHGGVWLKSGASKCGPWRTPNVHKMLRVGNIRGAKATIKATIAGPVHDLCATRRRATAILRPPDMADRSRGAMRPSFERLPPENGGRRESRALAAPAAWRANEKHTSFGHCKSNRSDPAFPAQWLYGL